jgi:exosortase A
VSAAPADRGANRATSWFPALSPAWRVAGPAVAVAITALVLLFGETALAIVGVWQSSDTFAHGWLIVPVCCWLVWDNRARLARLTPAPSAWGLAAMAVFAFGWLLGAVADVNVVQHLALAAMIQATVLAVLGPRVALALLFPLGYLYFAVPAGEFLVPPMQDWTAVFVVGALRLIGVPVFSDGVFIAIPTGNFEVAKACSGVRFLIAMVALGVLWAHISYRSWPRRLLFVALSVAVPIVANWLRAFGIVLIAYLTDNEFAIGVDHIVYGWVFFVIIIGLMFAVGTIFREPHAKVVSRVERPASAAGDGRADVHNAWGTAGVAVAALVIASSALGYDNYLQARSPATVDASPILTVGAPWQVDEASAIRWEPEFPGADAVVLRSFSAGGRDVSLAIGYYALQRQGAEAVSSEVALEDDEVWVRTRSGRVVAEIDGEQISVAYHRYRAGNWRRLVWYWYWVDGEFTAQPYMAKLLQARAALTGGRDEAAVIAVSVLTRGAVAAEAGEEPALRDFVASLDDLATTLEAMSANR